MKLFITLLFYLLISGPALYAQQTRLTKSFIDHQFLAAANQYKLMMNQLEDKEFPRSYDSSGRQLITSNSSWWCSGFYPGTLLYLYEQTKDETIKSEALKRLAILKNEQYNTGTHDLGFMMYCSFGNAYRLWKSDEHKQVLINSAHSLASRFSKTTGTIRSWNFGDWKYPVIIDNMMNLELLTWAAVASGDSTLKKIAITHTETTKIHHFRSDFSTWHLIDYDPLSGAVLKKQTVQGAADSSSWARGQAWALYGYTLMYRETGFKHYLLQARNIARYIFQFLPQDKIPHWDFHAQGVTSMYKDASAGAVIASALIELTDYVSRKERKQYRIISEKILHSLTSAAYLSKQGESGGFLLKHSVGNLPAQSEIDAPLSYADYYFIEAMVRYKNKFL